MGACLTSFDQVGKTYTFSLAGKESFQTIMGGIITIFKLLFMLLLLLYFGRDVALRQTPNFIAREDMLDEFPFRTLNETNSLFAATIYDGVNNINDRSYFDMEVVYTTFNRSKPSGQQFTFTSYPSETCSEKHVDASMLAKLANHYCFPNDFLVGGYWGADVVMTPTYLLKRCSTATELKYGVKCATDAELVAKIPNLYIFFNYMNHLMYPQNFDKPYKTVYPVYYERTNTNIKNYINYELFYNVATLATDAGFIWEDPVYQSFMEFDHLRRFDGHLEEFGEYTLMVQTHVSKRKMFYMRIYIRLGQILAIVMGYSGLTMSIVLMIYNFYLNNEYSIFLYGKLFNFEIDSVWEPNVDKVIAFKTESATELSPIKSDDKENDNEENNKGYKPIPITSSNALNKDLKKLITYQEKKRQRIEIASKERFCLMCCNVDKDKNDPNNKELIIKKELILAAEKIIEKQRDIFELWRKLDQNLLLKKMILNESQYYMLEKRGLRPITDKVHTDSLDAVRNLHDVKEEEDKKKFYEYIKELRLKNEVSDIDKFLWLNLDEDIKESVSDNIRSDNPEVIRKDN